MTSQHTRPHLDAGASGSHQHTMANSAETLTAILLKGEVNTHPSLLCAPNVQIKATKSKLRASVVIIEAESSAVAWSDSRLHINPGPQGAVLAFCVEFSESSSEQAFLTAWVENTDKNVDFFMGIEISRTETCLHRGLTHFPHGAPGSMKLHVTFQGELLSFSANSKTVDPLVGSLLDPH